MAENEWEVIDEVFGELQAEILRGLLESRDIQVWLSQESIGHTIYPVNIGPLGKIQILVSSAQSQAARNILDEYYSGKLQDADLDLPADQPPPDQG